MEQNKTHHSRIIFIIFIFIYVQFLRYFRSASRCFISSFKWVWTNSFNNINSYVYVQNSSKWQIMQIFFYSKFIREGYLSPKGLSNGQTHWHIVFWSFCRSKPEVLYKFFWFSFFYINVTFSLDFYTYHSLTRFQSLKPQQLSALFFCMNGQNIAN